MFTIEDGATTAEAYCGTCGDVTTWLLADSLNFGNIKGLCDGCDDEIDWTEIDHQAIRAEARRGF